MAGLLSRMSAADGFIFGTPNYVHSMSPGLVNLFCRMQPLITMTIQRNAQGAIIGAQSTSAVQGRRAAVMMPESSNSPWSVQRQP